MKIALIGITGRVGSRLATELLSHGHAVISASRFVTSDADALIAAGEKACVKRLLVVGEPAALRSRQTRRCWIRTGFPGPLRPRPRLARGFSKDSGRSLISTGFLSPSADLAPGERTGHFRLGGDQLLRDAEGKSHISMEDFAIAMVDELEQPTHSHQRFTVGY